MHKSTFVGRTSSSDAPRESRTAIREGRSEERHGFASRGREITSLRCVQRCRRDGSVATCDSLSSHIVRVRTHFSHGSVGRQSTTALLFGASLLRVFLGLSEVESRHLSRPVAAVVMQGLYSPSTSQPILLPLE